MPACQHVSVNRMRRVLWRIQKGAATMCANPGRYPASASERPLLVGHLMASAPPRARRATAASMVVSLLAHGAVLLMAASITTHHTEATPKLAGVQWTLPPDPAPPPVPLPEPVQRVEPVRPGPVGPLFGQLLAPAFDPTTIPPPSAVAPTDESLFGDARGTAVGETRPPAGGQPADPADNPGAFVPMSVAPELTNRAAVQRALQRLYPSMLRDAGIGGRVEVWVYVDESGSVIKAVVRQSSGQEQLDAAALAVVKVMRFRPALNQDQRVRVWVSVPVQFRVGD